MKRFPSTTKRAELVCGPSQQRGVGMIEVLIALLVVAIGILGAAALQAFSLSTNNSAMARSMATISSYSIVDAMRIDRANALGGAYDGTVQAGSCPSATGTLAERQLVAWCDQLGDNLGAVNTTTGSIDCDATTNVCEVAVTFDDSRSGGSNAVQVIVKTEI